MKKMYLRIAQNFD